MTSQLFLKNQSIDLIIIHLLNQARILGFSPSLVSFLLYISYAEIDFLFCIFVNTFKLFCRIFCKHYESTCVQNKIEALLVSLITSVLWFPHLPLSWIHYFFGWKVFSSGSFRKGLCVVNLLNSCMSENKLHFVLLLKC